MGNFPGMTPFQEKKLCILEPIKHICSTGKMNNLIERRELSTKLNARQKLVHNEVKISECARINRGAEEDVPVHPGLHPWPQARG